MRHPTTPKDTPEVFFVVGTLTTCPCGGAVKTEAGGQWKRAHFKCTVPAPKCQTCGKVYYNMEVFPIWNYFQNKGDRPNNPMVPFVRF